MLRFNIKSCIFASVIEIFQYILCYGSTTTQVKKKRCKMQISIHPMLRFNCLYNLRRLYGIIISIHPMLRFNEILTKIQLMLPMNFNTSYVTVQQGLYVGGAICINNFNTSYVTVQLKRRYR